MELVLLMFVIIYTLDVNSSSNEALHVELHGTKMKANKENSTALWHKRLGHISKARIQKLVSDGILQSLDFSGFDVYIECIKGK